jgi:hypothetical protein
VVDKQSVHPAKNEKTCKHGITDTWIKDPLGHGVSGGGKNVMALTMIG